MQIEADVAAWVRMQLQHLPCQPTAAAAKIQHRVEPRLRHVENRRTTEIVEGRLVGRADELTHFNRGDRQGGIRWLGHRVVQPISP